MATARPFNNVSDLGYTHSGRPIEITVKPERTDSFELARGPRGSEFKCKDAAGNVVCSINYMTGSQKGDTLQLSGFTLVMQKGTTADNMVLFGAAVAQKFGKAFAETVVKGQIKALFAKEHGGMEANTAENKFMDGVNDPAKVLTPRAAAIAAQDDVLTVANLRGPLLTALNNTNAVNEGSRFPNEMLQDLLQRGFVDGIAQAVVDATKGDPRAFRNPIAAADILATAFRAAKPKIGTKPFLEPVTASTLVKGDFHKAMADQAIKAIAAAQQGRG